MNDFHDAFRYTPLYRNIYSKGYGRPAMKTGTPSCWSGSVSPACFLSLPPALPEQSRFFGKNDRERWLPLWDIKNQPAELRDVISRQGKLIAKITGR